ncbi:MAG: MFS transporter [Lacisediminihabitans sp.]
MAQPSSEAGDTKPERSSSKTATKDQGRFAPPRDVGRASRVRWRLFLLLLLLVTINYVDRGSISVAMPLIQKDFTLTPAEIGLLSSAFFWTYALMQIPIGWVIDRYGPRKVIAGSAFGWGLATAASGLAWGFGSLFWLRSVIGIAEAGIYPSGGKLNATWMTQTERGRGATILDGGAPLGSAIGGIAIVGLILLTGSWRPAFIIAGLATVLVGFLAWWYIRNNPREHKSANAAEIEHIELAHAEEERLALPEGATGPGKLRNFFRYRSFWAMCTGWLGFNGVFYGLLTWGPLYLFDARGFKLSDLGWSTFAIFGAGFVGEIIGGLIADYWRSRGGSANLVMRVLLGFAAVMVVAGLFGVIVTPNALTAVALLSVVLFFLRWVGLFWSLPATLGGPARAGILGGAMNFSGNISGFVTPIAVGLIVGATGGYTWALLYFVAAGVLMLASVLTIDYTKRLPI